jgi:Arc/MetJ-type ribon-helix-helix transcriptional regulator
MSSAKIAITIEESLLRQVDRWVREGQYKNRSQAIQAILQKESERRGRNSLAAALKHVDAEARRQAQAMAEEWSYLESEWPEY